jgi:hypothetical protein
MKRINVFVICIVFFLITLMNAGAENTSEQKKSGGAVSAIEGAFGVKLGENYDANKGLGKSNLADETSLYQFPPIKPYDKCDSYYVLITPETKIIYSILAQGEMESKKTCKREQKVLMEQLTSKYGSTKEKTFLSLQDLEKITQGDRDVYIECTGSDSTTLRVVYTDHKLGKQAEEERSPSEAAEEKTDDMKIVNKIVVVKTFEEPSPLTLFAPQGTTVIWVNHSRYPVEILFIEKKVVIACSSPSNFFVGENGSYESNKIPSGGTASLCFIDKGRYVYKTYPSKNFVLGKKGKEHIGTVWIK